MRISRLSFWTVGSLLLGLFLAAGPAYAEKRVALVIGNSAYKNVGKLTNPNNDATAVAELFRKVGFEVVDVRHDLGNNDLRRAIREFSATIRDVDIAVVYYAGHGIEVDGTNYLIPTDATLQQDVDVEDETLALDRVLRMLEPARRLRLVILDACRDNPFARTMKRTVSSRSIGRGLAKVELTASDTLIAFAAKAGSTVADGDGANSPYTTALVKHIAEPGLDVRLAFGRVRDDVLRSTKSKQEPFVYGSLGGSTVSLTPPTPTPQVVSTPHLDTPAAKIDPNAEMRRDYELAAQIGTKGGWNSFLAVHTKGLYADLAREARSKILASEKAEAEAAAAKMRADVAERAKAANAEAERAKAEAAKVAAAKAEREKIEASDRAKAAAAKSEAQTQAKPQVATVMPPSGAASSGACSRIVGAWRWPLGQEVVFTSGGSTRSTNGDTGSWTCAHKMVVASWRSGFVDRITLSADGSKLSVTNNSFGSFLGTRK